MCREGPVHLVAHSHRVAKPNHRRSPAPTQAKAESGFERPWRKRSASGPSVAYSFLLLLLLVLLLLVSCSSRRFSSNAAAYTHDGVSTR